MLSAVLVWAIYNLLAILLLVYPAAISIWITIFSLKKFSMLLRLFI